MIPIFQVNAFTGKPFAGNPAMVCLLRGPAEESWMAAAAREFNVSESAFLHPADEGYALRWFTPTREVDLCGHATLAAAHVLWETGRAPRGSPIRFRTRSGILGARRRGEWADLDLPSDPPREAAPPPGLRQALGAEIRWVGRNRIDFLVELEGEAAVRGLRPDIRALADLSRREGAEGVIVTARADGANHDIVSRYFAPACGIDEDPVTGAAHCGLGPYWAPRLHRDALRAWQASPRGGYLEVEPRGDRVRLGGQAVLILAAGLREAGDPPSATAPPEGVRALPAGARRISVFQVDAFSRKPLQGNPAAVVPVADSLTPDAMQRLAAELNKSETAFVLPPDGADHQVRVRFFTPVAEVPSCGHAAVAAHAVRALRLGRGGKTVQGTGAGAQPVAAHLEGDRVRVTIAQGRPVLAPPLQGRNRQAVLAALGIAAAEVDPRCPVQVVSTGHSKVLVGVVSGAVLQRLDPDPRSLSQASGRVGANGFFVFTLEPPEPGLLTEARMFAPAIGIREDPVTGNGHGPLGAYLVEHGLATLGGRTFRFRGMQGRRMGRPGVVEVAVEVKAGRPVGVQISGDAVVVYSGEMLIPEEVAQGTGSVSVRTTAGAPR